MLRFPRKWTVSPSDQESRLLLENDPEISTNSASQVIFCAEQTPFSPEVPKSIGFNFHQASQAYYQGYEEKEQDCKQQLPSLKACYSQKTQWLPTFEAWDNYTVVIFCTYQTF
jgi:hypothetical protein